MIRKGFQYAYPIARVRTLLGNLLRQQDYHHLLYSEGTQEVLAYLRTTAYRREIGETGEEPSSFALPLYNHFLSMAEKVTALLPRSAQDLCRTFLTRFEIEALKVFLRAAGEQTERAHLLSLLHPLAATSSLPLDRLLEAKSVHEIAEALTGTPYAEPVQGGVENLPSPRSLFSLEVRLDRWFLARLFASSAPFSGQERRIVRRLLGILADVTNILWSQRLRTTFNLSPQETLSLLLPYGFHLTERKRQALAEWDGQGPLPFFFPGVERPDAPLRLSLMRVFCREALRPLLTIPFQAGVPFAYLLLAEIEVADLKTLWEGKKWQVAPAELADQLIRFHGSLVLGSDHV
jgi:V/A-type H+-transporting ATPase subunit C